MQTLQPLAARCCAQILVVTVQNCRVIQFVQVIHACLRTAAALHAAQIVHRDFRHANILWDTDGPFVIDLELAAVPPIEVRLFSCHVITRRSNVSSADVE